MSRRSTGVLFGLLTFVAIAAVALISTAEREFVSGLPGIEADIESRSLATLQAKGTLPTTLEVDGRDVTATFANGIPDGIDQVSLRKDLLSLEGVRSVRVLDGTGAVGATTGVEETDAATESNVETGQAADNTAPIDLAGGDTTPAAQLLLSFDGSEADLAGVVADDSTAAAVLGEAAQYFVVDSDLTIDPQIDRTASGGEVSDQFASILEIAAGRFSSGQINLDSDEMQVSGVVVDEAQGQAAAAELAALSDAIGLRLVVESTVADSTVVDPAENAASSDESAVTDEPAPESQGNASDSFQILFAPGTDELTSESRAGLDAVAAQLASRGPIQVRVEAHVHTEGDPDANLLLSELRANAVAEYLIDQGVGAAEIVGLGRGASVPFAEPGSEVNDRVELVLIEGN